MPQLANITFQSGVLRNLKWPYHANVMNALEQMSSSIVRMLFERSSDPLMLQLKDGHQLTPVAGFPQNWVTHSTQLSFRPVCFNSVCL
jgi:hypothetical protein